MSLFAGGNKKSSNVTNISNDNRQTDNKVAAENSTVLTSGGGSLTNQAGAVVAGERSNISIQSVDPGSYAFAGEVVDRAFASVAATQSAAGSMVAAQGETVAKLAQGTPIGIDWKGMLLPLAVVGAVLALVFLRRKG